MSIQVGSTVFYMVNSSICMTGLVIQIGRPDESSGGWARVKVQRTSHPYFEDKEFTAPLTALVEMLAPTPVQECCVMRDGFGNRYVIPVDKRRDFFDWDNGDDLAALTWARPVERRQDVIFTAYRIE